MAHSPLDRIPKLKDFAASRKKAHQRVLRLLKKRPRGWVDDRFHELHEEVFEEVDCLQCANCCKTTSPIFLNKDIDRLAAHLRMKPSSFVQTYLRLDEEGDYVLQSAPCPFLGPDNYCSVYEARPRACREYPHTNRKNMLQITGLTLRNAAVCPAVFEVLERMEQRM